MFALPSPFRTCRQLKLDTDVETGSADSLVSGVGPGPGDGLRRGAGGGGGAAAAPAARVRCTVDVEGHVLQAAAGPRDCRRHVVLLRRGRRWIHRSVRRSIRGSTAPRCIPKIIVHSARLSSGKKNPRAVPTVQNQDYDRAMQQISENLPPPKVDGYFFDIRFRQDSEKAWVTRKTFTFKRGLHRRRVQRCV